MLAGEEDARRVLDHVVLLPGVAGDDGSCEDIVVVARRAGGDEGVGALGPGVRPPARDDGLARYRDRRVPEDALEDGDAAPDDDVVGDVLHDARGLAGHEGEEDGRLVKVPKQEELPSAGRRGTHVPEQVGTLVPKDAVETEDNLV